MDVISFVCIFLQPVYVIIERDEETKKIQASIKAGMSANASHLQSYLSTWDRYAQFRVMFTTIKTYRKVVLVDKLHAELIVPMTYETYYCL